MNASAEESATAGVDAGAAAAIVVVLSTATRQKAEQVDELKSYLAELRLEVQAVEERLADLEK